VILGIESRIIQKGIFITNGSFAGRIGVEIASDPPSLLAASKSTRMRHLSPSSPISGRMYFSCGSGEGKARKSPVFRLGGWWRTIGILIKDNQSFSIDRCRSK
jgi:hypothetical protein